MKQMEIKKVTIGERDFYIKPFGAFTAARISGDIASTVAPIVSGLSPFLIGQIGDNAIETACDALANLDGEKLEKLATVLLLTYNNVTYAGEETNNRNVPLSRDIIDEIFCCDLQDMIALCIEVVKLNFGSFFSKLMNRTGNLIGNMGAEMA